jgi:Ca2+-binding EF-hand superfamily protein
MRRSHSSNISNVSGTKPFTEQIELEKTIKLRVDEIWHNYDEDNSGQLDKPEAKKFTTHILKAMRGPKYNVSTGVLEAWFREFDTDNSGTISKEEMVNFIKKVGKFGKHPNLKLIIGENE